MAIAKKCCNMFFVIFDKVFLVLPLGMAALFAVVYLDGGWEDILPGHGPGFYFLPELRHKLAAALILVFLCLLCAGAARAISRLGKRIQDPKAAYLLSGACIFAAGLAVRMPLLFLFREDIQPFSDFQCAWCMAHGEMEGYIEYYSLFPSYLNFAVFLKMLVRVFGDRYMCVIYLNAVLASVTASLVYFITREVTGTDRAALPAGLLYALLPSNIVYCASGTPEFLAIAWNTLGMLLLLRAMKAERRRRAVLILLGGAAIGLGSSYKSFGIIIIIAFVMVYAAKNILGEQGHAMKRKRCLAVLLCAVLVFSGYKLANGAVVRNTEHVLQISIDRGAPYPHYFLIGLNTQGEGQIHLGNLSREYYRYYLNNGMDARAAKEHAIEVLEGDWRGHGRAGIILHFMKKMIWAWQDDNIPLFYFKDFIGLTPDTPPERLVYRFMGSYMGAAGQFYYLGLLLLALFGCAFPGGKKAAWLEKELFRLVIFGYFCLMALSESQSRYKCLIMPYVCILASMGIAKLWQKPMEMG